jgi:hypothetical protein
VLHLSFALKFEYHHPTPPHSSNPLSGFFFFFETVVIRALLESPYIVIF